MRTTFLLLIGLTALLCAPVPDTHSADRQAANPKKVTAFSLKDPRTQRTITLEALRKNKVIVVVFLGTECPLNNLYVPVLAKLHKEFSERGVAFVGINSNEQDTPTEVAQHAQRNEVPFPIVKDPGNKVADQFGADRTPESFVLNQQGEILYRGRIDDQFGIRHQRPGKPRRRDLAEAIKEVLAEKKVSVVLTEVEGCLIGRTLKPKTSGKITFYHDVLPILQNHCQECHRPGRIGPMPLKKYEDVVAWSGMIREVVSEGRMPPWLADPKHGDFANDRRLSKDERATLLGWIDEGLVKGDPKNAPPEKKFVKGWAIGKPDVVFKMPKPFKVPAEMPIGGVAYKYFSVKTDFEEDRWITRAEARPDAEAVVHHILVFIQPPGRFFNPEHPESTLCGTAPGDLPAIYPEGYAKLLPKGSRLVIQMHYTPNGKEYVDQSEVGLVFAKKPPKYRVLTKPILNYKFNFRRIMIPANDPNFKIEASWTIKKPARILSLMPHMHLRGKDFRYDVITPEGERETLLSVPRYDFNWQSAFAFREPLQIRQGTRIHCVAHFDNSKSNPNNPDPTKRVGWGDQTWQEMMIGWIDYAYENE